MILSTITRPVAALLLAAAATAAPAAAPLAFDDVFGAKGEPAGLHYTVAYRAGPVVHHMTVWRDGDRRLMRATDGAIESYATHRPGDPAYTLTILDLKRRLRTDLDRDSLYRIGNFTDWYDLGHGLRHPKGRYTLVALATPPTALPAIAPCRWYALTQGPRTTDICWSTGDRLPLVMTDGRGRTVWRVLSAMAGPVPASRFVIHDKGFVHNDAIHDIDRD